MNKSISDIQQDYSEFSEEYKEIFINNKDKVSRRVRYIIPILIIDVFVFLMFIASIVLFFNSKEDNFLSVIFSFIIGTFLVKETFKDIKFYNELLTYDITKLLESKNYIEDLSERMKSINDELAFYRLAYFYSEYTEYVVNYTTKNIVKQSILNRSTKERMYNDLEESISKQKELFDKWNKDMCENTNSLMVEIQTEETDILLHDGLYETLKVINWLLWDN